MSVFSNEVTVLLPPGIKPISDQKLNATISQEATLLLPDIGAEFSYFVLSNQKFKVSVDGNILKVQSTDKKDVGSHTLDFFANSTADKVNFKVIVLFSSLENSTNVVKISEISNTAT